MDTTNNRAEDQSTQTGHVMFHLEEQMEKNALKKFDAEYQEQLVLRPEFQFVSMWKRPEHSYSSSFFNGSLLEREYGIKVLIDESIKQTTATHFTSNVGLGSPHTEYSVWKSPQEKTSDVNRNQAGLMSISEIDEILVTAIYVILEDVKNATGPLFNPERLEKQNDKNLDIGYCFLEDLHSIDDEETDLNVVWVENVRPKDGEPREYHIHAMPAGRFYKEGRYFLSHAQKEVVVYED